MAVHFPEWRVSSEKAVNLQKRYFLALGNDFLNPTEETKMSLNALIKEIMRQNAPKKFSAGEGSVLITHMAEFQELCALLEEHYTKVPETLFEFASRIEAIKKKYKKQVENNGAIEPK